MGCGHSQKNQWKGEVLVGNDLRGITASKPTRGPVTQRNADRQQRGDDQQLPCQRLPPEPPRQWYPQQ